MVIDWGNTYYLHNCNLIKSDPGLLNIKQVILHIIIKIYVQPG